MTNEEKSFLLVLKDIVHPGKEMSDLSAIDWKIVLDIAKKQNLFSLIYDAAVKYPSFKDFNEANPRLFSNAAVSVVTQMQKTNMFIELYKSFAANGLYPVVVKGIICRSLYGDKADFRPSGDEDILIEKKDYNKAVEILNSNGYYSTDIPDEKLDYIQEVTFCSNFDDGRPSLMIELHLNPFGTKSPKKIKMNSWFKKIFNDFETEVIQDTPVRTMKPTDHFLFLIFHALNHFTKSGFGIRLMLDALLFAEKYSSSIKWDYIMKGLDDVGAVGFLNDLTSIGNTYLGFDFPEKYETVCPESLLADMFNMGTFGNTTRADMTAGIITINAVCSENNRKNKFSAYLRMVFPSWKTWLSLKPYLADRPFMLPVEWVKRVCRYIRGETISGNLSEIDESYRISEARLELLKKYDIV